jgi:Tfp pilus assembly protein PilF
MRLPRPVAGGKHPRTTTRPILLCEAGRVNDAEAAYRQAIATAHTEWAPRSMLNLGVLFQKLGRHDEAATTCRRASGS